MKVELKIPVMGESVVEVTIGTLFKPSGSSVSLDEEILEMETDKVNQVLTAPAAGKLLLTVKSGDRVQVGAVVGTIDSEATSELPKEPPKPKQQEELRPPAAKVEEKPLPPTKAEGGPLQKPLPSEKIEKQKISPPQKQPRPPQDGKRRERMSGLRKVIAERLVKVKNETAMLTTFNEVDLSTVMAVREKEQEEFQKRHGVKLGFMSFFVKASLAALEEFPLLSAQIEGDEIVYPEKNHIGVAVSTDRGLMVPVIRNAADLSFAEIEKKLKEYAEAARRGTLSIDAMQGGIFTITNGGVFGSLLSTPILNPPQSAILGMHTIVKRPIVIDDQIVIRPMMYLALSYDHRIVDGKEAIQFLLHIKNTLEEPTRLLLEL